MRGSVRERQKLGWQHSTHCRLLWPVKGKIRCTFRTRIRGYSKTKNRQDDAKAELLDPINTFMYFYFKTRTAHFPIRHVNKTPQKMEVPNLKFLRGFIMVRWEYGQN